MIKNEVIKVKKGQAAMEFLMTYGWAILVVLVAIGALAYFGVLNPSKFLPSSCTLGPGMGCDDFKVTATDAQLVLRNGIGDSLTATSVAISGCTASAEADGDDAWTDGSVLGGDDGITLTSCTNGNSGDRFKADVVITYTSSSGVNHTVTGDITTKIE